MVGTIVQQQGIVSSVLAEKVHQGKQDSIPVYQETAATKINDKREKDRQRVRKSKKPDDIYVNDRGGRRNRNKKQKDKNQNGHESATASDDDPGLKKLLDIRA